MRSDAREAVPGSILPTASVDIAPGAPGPGRFPDAGSVPILVLEHIDDLRNVRRTTMRLPLRIISPDGILDAAGKVMKQEDILAELTAGTQGEETPPARAGAPARAREN